MVKYFQTLGFAALLWSCTPENYVYYPAQRNIHHKFDLHDSVYIYPFAKYSLFGEQNLVLGIDSSKIAWTEQFSGDYLNNLVAKKIKITKKVREGEERDSLASQFSRMIDFFYNHRNKNYKLKINSKKKGYALLLGVDIQIWEFSTYLELKGYHKGGTGHYGRHVNLYYLCLVNLQDGRVLFYDYHYTQFKGGFNQRNELTDPVGFRKNINNDIFQLSNKLLGNP